MVKPKQVTKQQKKVFHNPTASKSHMILKCMILPPCLEYGTVTMISINTPTATPYLKYHMIPKIRALYHTPAITPIRYVDHEVFEGSLDP